MVEDNDACRSGTGLSSLRDRAAEGVSPVPASIPSANTIAAWGGHAIKFIDAKGLTPEFNDWCGGWTCPVAPDSVAMAESADRADWLLDAIACATQDRRFLRGDPEYDEVSGEAIILNAKKAIEVAIGRYASAMSAGTAETEWLGAKPASAVGESRDAQPEAQP